MSSEIELPLEARQKYLERRKQDLLDCRNAITNHDFECLKKVGHQIKGNASTFGFEQLAPIAIEIETLANKKDLENLPASINRLAACLDQIHLP